MPEPDQHAGDSSASDAAELRAFLRTLVRVGLLLAAVLAIALLAGCGGGGDDGPDKPTPQVNCAIQSVECR